MRTCTICGKGSQMQGERKLLRGHYNPVNWSRKYPNLQWARLPAGASAKVGVDGVRVKVCTGCLRTMQKKTKRTVSMKSEVATVN